MTEPTAVPLLLQGLDYAGVAVFAVTGALVAARKRHDLVAFAFFAAVTGIGGGTLRDLLLGVPVFWIEAQGYLIVTTLAAFAVWLVGTGSTARERWLLWLDAVGLAAYCVLGTAKALSVGAPPVVAVVMGVLTATFGGVVRDLVAGEPSVLLKREIYITAALAGASVYTILAVAGMDASSASVIAFTAALFIRAGALWFGWTLPGWRAEDEGAGRDR